MFDRNKYLPLYSLLWRVTRFGFRYGRNMISFIWTARKAYHNQDWHYNFFLVYSIHIVSSQQSGTLAQKYNLCPRIQFWTFWRILLHQLIWFVLCQIQFLNSLKCIELIFHAKYRAQGLKITQNVAFDFLAFFSIFCTLKVTCLVTLFDRKFTKMAKLMIFGIFHTYLSITIKLLSCLVTLFDQMVL